MLTFIVDEKIPVPIFYDAAIYSEEAQSLTSHRGMIRFDLCSETDSSFHNAKIKLINTVNTIPIFSWLKVWVDDSDHAYEKRSEYHKLIEALTPKLTGMLAIQ